LLFYVLKKIPKSAYLSTVCHHAPFKYLKAGDCLIACPSYSCYWRWEIKNYGYSILQWYDTLIGL